MSEGADQVPNLPQPPALVGGRFEVRTKIGDGGMGHVFRAYDRKAAREVALKLLTPHYLGRAEREDRLLREAALAQRAHHPNLIQVLDAGRLAEHNWPFLVMELIEGPSLAFRLTDGPLPPRLAVRFARQIAGAARALHDANVVHRDINTMNVLVRDNNEAVLIDLSHAGDLRLPRVAAGGRGRLTKLNEVPGTHLYMSKEQANADPADPAMDVYAFGVTLIHMLTGRAPYGYEREEFIKLQREGLVKATRIDPRVYPLLPLPLVEVANQCVEDEREQRPTMAQVVARLDQLLAAMVMPAAEQTRPLEAANDLAAMVFDRMAPSTVALPLDVAATSQVAGHVPESQSDESGASRPALAGQRLKIAFVALTVLLVAALSLALFLGYLLSGDHTVADAGVVVTSQDPAPSEYATSGAGEVGTTTDADEVGTTHDAAGVLSESTAAVDESTGTSTGGSETTDASAEPAAEPHRKQPIVRPAKPRCNDEENRARDAYAGRQWSLLLSLTSKSKCWTDQTTRMKRRVRALQILKRYTECAALETKTHIPEVKRIAQACAATIAKGASQ